MTVVRDGSIVLFEPQTPAARLWVSENVTIESWQWMGTAFAVDVRMAGDLAAHMKDAGLEVGDG